MGEANKKDCEIIENQAEENALLAAIEDDGNENRYLVVFRNPFVFENETYESVDLSGLEDLSAGDMIAVNKIMTRGGDFFNVLPEMSLEYACLISSRATGKPVEFFKALPPKEALKVKNRVTSFFYSED